jgi:hypothetical protein
MNSKLVLNIFLILAIAYMLIVRILLIFSYSIDLDGVEFVFVRHIQVLIDNKNIYTNPAELPYASCLYLPGYLYLVKGILSFCNELQRADLHFIFVVGRAASFLALLAQTGLLVFYWRKRFQVTWNVILGLLCFYLMLISGHMYVVRPDAMKFLFFTIALFSLIEYEFFNQKFLYLSVSVLFAVFSVYFKQDMLIYQSIIIGILWLFTRKHKYILVLLVFWLSVAAVYGLLLLAFGKYFIDNTVMMNFQQVSHSATSPNMVFLIFSAIRILPLLVLLEYFRRKKREQFQSSAPIQYALWVVPPLFILSHLSILRAGSYINYAYETIFVVLFVVGASLNFILSDLKNLRSIRVLVVLYIGGVLVGNWLIHSYTYSFAKESQCKKEYQQHIATAKELKAIIRKDMVFFPNVTQVIYNRNLNLIYGYDYHLGRFISLIILKGRADVDSRLMFYDSKNYDDCFLKGTVKYIVNETAKDGYIRKYHPNFLPYTTVGNLTVYQYSVQ